MSHSAEKEMSKGNEKEMPFLEHLEELRSRLIKSLLAVVFCAAVSGYYVDDIFTVLVTPYTEAISLAKEKRKQKEADTSLHKDSLSVKAIQPVKEKEHNLADSSLRKDSLFVQTIEPAKPQEQKPETSDDIRLIFTNPTGGFMIHFKLAITVGILFSIPVVVYQLWQFIAPGLMIHERRIVVGVVFFTTLCFLLGALFCYHFVLKFGLSFLLSFQTDILLPLVSIDEYFGFVTILLVVFGLVFEMPVIAYFLTRIGLLTPEFLRQKRRYGIVTIFVAAAVLTPSVDAFTQILLAAPLLVLYEISIWVSKAALPKEMKRALSEVATN
jgi:sec-independent protein translocase protein TatC